MTDSPIGTEAATARRRAFNLAAATAIAAILATLVVTAAANWNPSYVTFLAVAGLGVVVALAIAAMSYQHASLRTAAELEAQNTSLVAASEELATANLARARFIADISHDMRQPLHALGLFLDALERRVTPGEGEKILARTREASTVLNRAFSAMIDLTKVEADTLIPEVEVFAVDDLLVRLEEETASVAASAGIDLRVVHSQAHVIADQRLVGHMLRSVLSNAVENGPGRLLLGAHHEPDRLWLQLHCSEPGKSTAKWDVLTVGSARASGRSVEELDLLVVRRLADLMGLGLRVTIKADRGVTIAIGVPKAGDAAASPLRNRTVLLVADEASRRVKCAALLAGAGAVVHVACNLRQADHAARTNRFDLLVTDIAAAEATASETRARIGASLPSLPNRTPADELVAAAQVRLTA